MSVREQRRERVLAAVKKHRHDTGGVARELGITYDHALLVLRQVYNHHNIPAVKPMRKPPVHICPVCGMGFWNIIHTRRKIDETGCPDCRGKNRKQLKLRLIERFKAGAPIREIAEEFGTTRQYMHNARQYWKTTGKVFAVGERDGGRLKLYLTCECGKERHPGSQRCSDCSIVERRKNNDKAAEPIREAIIMLAKKLGHIPTSTQGALFLDCARDTANRHIRAVFGDDPRKGGARRKGYRPLPDWIGQ